MTRCDYDVVFYRVFCITLIAIALTFTIILTNVFVDIDGLLTNERGIVDKNSGTTANSKDDVDITFNPETYAEHDNEKSHEDAYRDKRSLETKNFLFRIKNPQMKRVLTNHLATLLDELDTENTENPGASKSQKESEISIEKNKEDKRTDNNKDDKEDLLHADIHKVVVQGLLGHMDFNEVYERVHKLRSKNDKSEEDQIYPKAVAAEPSVQISENKMNPKYVSMEEKNIFNEIINCKEVRNQVIDATKKIKEESRRKDVVSKAPKVIIKTVIDITSLPASERPKPEINSNEDVEGLIKLIYNGKSIKFNRIDDEETTITPWKIKKSNKTPIEKKDKYYENETLDKEEHNKYINKIIQEYIKRSTNYEEMSEVKQETKRMKRHIKIRYDNENNNIDDILHKSKVPTQKDDDELFVEIETHFDSKGTKGEKKKKLIRNLIEKIQKAIHSKPEDDKKKLTHLHIKKRIQESLNPINKGRLINKISLPYSAILHRHLDPIGKLLPVHESLTYMIDKSSETFKENYNPKFLAVSKAINSAERRELDVDYNKVMLVNGIPERIQKPLNTDYSEEIQNGNAYNDKGNMKFFVKDIDGSGFSIGFNQYVDEPPDNEAIKLFTGLENIIQTYHQTYDQTEAPNESDKVELKTNYEDIDNPPIKHTIIRRSTDSRFGDDHHSNEYKIIFNNNFLPYQHYEDICNRKLSNIKSTTKFIKNYDKDKLTKNTLLIDEDIFNKNLKPSEIFGLANLIHRKKRSININRISSLKSKMKLNRYLNTRSKITKRIFLNKRRNKRQVNKIRIIATDTLPNLRKHSDEDIFVVSNENLFADRAVVREVETPQIGHEKTMEDHYDFISPYIYEEQPEQHFVTNAFDEKSRHNILMSKYPHIFMDEIPRSKEEEISPENALLFNKYMNVNPTFDVTGSTAQVLRSATNIPLPKVEEIVNAIAPQNGKTNYKVTVKIMPKNSTDLHSGFKEIHTSINKSFNKNGLIYSSLVNVSEISKIAKINKTDNLIKAEISTQSPVVSQIMRQREKMNSLLKQHKNRIDEQLKHLNKEKEKLDRIALTTENEFEASTQDKFFNLVLPFDPPKLLKLTKEEVNKLAVASLLKSYENPVVDIPFTITTTSAKATPKTTTRTTTKSLATTTPTTTESMKHIERQFIEQKTNMIKNIEKNGNVTNEILKKIDRNTEILQAFLRKLTENLNLITPRHEVEANNPIKYDTDHLKKPVNHLTEPFNQVISNMEANNDTHVTIPFVYAYQHSYPIDIKPETPVASVLYHGHIHTNTINKRKTEEWQVNEDKKSIKGVDTKNGRRVSNQTKFFIDELENDFKPIPVGIDKKNDYIKLVNNTNI